MASNIKEEQTQLIANCLYIAALVSGALFALLIIIHLLMSWRSFSDEKISSLAKQYWLVLYAFQKDSILSFQSSHQCCGWTNVFDYCTTGSVLEIAFEALRHKEMLALFE